MAYLTGIRQETLEQLTTHLVLSRNLPPCHEHESILIKLVLDAFRSINEIVSFPTSSKKLLQNFQKLHPVVDPITISTELQNLSPGEMLEFYVRKQNSCLVVYHTPKPSLPKEYIISTFSVSMKKSEINGCDGDIQVYII